MVLNFQVSFVFVLFILSRGVGTVPTSAAGELDVVVDDYAVMDDMKFRLSGDFTFFVKDRAMECDVVSLPLAGFTAGVDEGFGAAVGSASLSVWVGDVLVAIEHLNFILPQEKNTAIPAPLAGALGDGWSGEFDMQSARSKFFFALDVAASAD